MSHRRGNYYIALITKNLLPCSVQQRKQLVQLKSFPHKPPPSRKFCPAQLRHGMRNCTLKTLRTHSDIETTDKNVLDSVFWGHKVENVVKMLNIEKQHWTVEPSRYVTTLPAPGSRFGPLHWSVTFKLNLLLYLYESTSPGRSRCV